MTNRPIPNSRELVERGWVEIWREPPPEGEWLRTWLLGEAGESVSYCRRMSPDEDLEWIDPEGYTTVTHSTYAAPTHYKRLPRLGK